MPVMLVDEIHELWDRRPFQAFDIVMADGSVFTVTSPKLILMTPSQRTLHLVTPEGKSHWLALSQVTRVSLENTDDSVGIDPGGQRP